MEPLDIIPAVEKRRTMFAAVEAGGTTFRVAIAYADNLNTLIDRVVIPTTTPKETLSAVVSWLKERRFDALGVACFGPLDLDPDSDTFGYITTTPKQGWHNTNIAGALDIFNCPFVLDTDVNAPALAVFNWHAAKVAIKSRRLATTAVAAYLTVGTGVGVGLCVGGNLIHGLVHPEAGHVLLPRYPGDDFEGTCAYHKDCVESLISTPALSKRLSVTHEDLPHVSTDNPIWDLIAHYLGCLCANLVTTISPSVIVIGGGVLTRECLYARICKKTLEKLNGYISSPLLTPERISEYIVRSPFGIHAGITGGMHLAQFGFKNTPPLPDQ